MFEDSGWCIVFVDYSGHLAGDRGVNQKQISPEDTKSPKFHFSLTCLAKALHLCDTIYNPSLWSSIGCCQSNNSLTSVTWGEEREILPRQAAAGMRLYKHPEWSSGWVWTLTCMMQNIWPNYCAGCMPSSMRMRRLPNSTTDSWLKPKQVK